LTVGVPSAGFRNISREQCVSAFQPEGIFGTFRGQRPVKPDVVGSGFWNFDGPDRLVIFALPKSQVLVLPLKYQRVAVYFAVRGEQAEGTVRIGRNGLRPIACEGFGR